MINNEVIECYISKNDKEITKFIKYKKAYGVIRFDIGKTALIFKQDDLKKIIGG